MRLLSRLYCLPLLLIAGSASAVSIDWTSVGGAGNACDPQPTGFAPGCYGAVGYSYSIEKYEVTTAQYVEFLNAKAAVTDPFALYNPQMDIRRTGVAGAYPTVCIPAMRTPQ